MIFDKALYGGSVEIAHGDDSHKVRPIPISVKLFQCFVLEALDDFLLPCGQTFGIAGTLEQDGELYVLGRAKGYAV
jgi:hypothetical protein